MVLGATAYNALRNVTHDLTGPWWGIEVEELDDEEDEEINEEEDEATEDEEDEE